MTKYLALVALVVGWSTKTWAIDAGCDYYQVISPGKTYYVYSPGYPESYTGQHSCRWYAKSATKVKISCQTFSLPASNNCAGDRLSISPSGNLQLADAHNYCGVGTFDTTSNGNNMNIVFTAFKGTSGGRFLCTLEATPNASSPTCNCGWKKQSRIVGGTTTVVNEFPMMAGIVDVNKRLVFCGATIISPTVVASAAHCLQNMPTKETAVLVGDHDVSTGTDTSAAVLHLVAKILLHPSYSVDTNANDISLVFTLEPIVFNMDVGPACLPFAYASTTFVGNEVEMLGWGTLEFAGAKSDVLQKVKVNVTSINRCQQSFPQVTNKQICTYTPGKDACQFDSGGPLLWQNEYNGRLFLIGIISFGELCADKKPAVNTRMGAYLDWILSNTPDGYCRVQ
ncbi:venom serine protease 34-like [Neodiprion virginianus]|uniref:venom serine protease 34-like n=1 Tax=Neodiprion virginianus TaxID=2961670 RepID=UPI001EE732F1|nr:venom serine protease 34-like [Neodiprion virginianus]